MTTLPHWFDERGGEGMDAVDRAILAQAARQHGAFGLWQYEALGGSLARALRHVRAGRWRRCFRSSFVVVGSPQSYEQRLAAGVFACGPGARASHRASGRLWSLIPRLSAPIEVTAPRSRWRAPAGVVLHRELGASTVMPVLVEGIPASPVGKTLIELGAVAPQQVRPAMWQAMRDGLVDWNDVLQALVDHGGRGRPGTAHLRALLAEHYGQIAGDSATEDRYFQILIDGGLPRPERLVPLRCADGVVVTVDFHWPRFGVVVEVYGVDHFTNERVQQLDAVRVNQLTLAGYSVLVVTGKMLHRPDQVVRDVGSLLVARGLQTAA